MNPTVPARHRFVGCGQAGHLPPAQMPPARPGTGHRRHGIAQAPGQARGPPTRWMSRLLPGDLGYVTGSDRIQAAALRQRASGCWQVPTADFLAALPRDARQLYDRLRADSPADRHRYTGVLTYAIDALQTGLVPADLRAAVYRALLLRPPSRWPKRPAPKPASTKGLASHSSSTTAHSAPRSSSIQRTARRPEPSPSPATSPWP